MQPRPLHLNIPISKIDEEQRMVWGYATVEEIDAANEIVGYEASKKAFTGWIGNIREMHDDKKAVGKKVEVKFDDANKGVWLGAKVSESADGQNAWVKVKEGVLAGFSIGGRINAFEMVTVKGQDGNDEEVVKITNYDLAEVSLVDNPACPSATLQMVKNTKKGLQATEQLGKGVGRPVHWWEKMYKFSDAQEVMKPSLMIYNSSSMAKKQQNLKKDIWSAGYLTYLGKELAYYIGDLSYEGKETKALIGALEAIKEAAVGELQEPEKWPEAMGEAVELAMKTLGLTKKDLKEGAMAAETKENKKTEKTVVGQEDRDADGNVVVTAEENGKGPVSNNEPAETVAPVEGDEAENADDNKVETEVPAATEDEGEDPKPAKKPAKAPKKSTQTDDLTKSISAAVEAAVTKAVEPLQKEIDTLKAQPKALKGKGSYVDVEKAAPVEGEEDKLKQEFDELNKRADELAADPSKGTMRERVEIATKMRTLQFKMSPSTMAKHNAVRATFSK